MRRVLVGVLLCAAAAWPMAPVVRAQMEAVVPVPRAEIWGDRPETWIGRFYNNVRQVQTGDVDLLFIGDSITHGWETTGRATWDRYYGHRKAVNLGFGGDRTQHVLWRLINGHIDRMSPKVAVIMIGTNNASSDTPNEIALGIRAICNTLRALLPQTKILVLGIFPRGTNPDNWLRGTTAVVNTQIAALADGEWVHYLDIGSAFLEADGTLPASVMPDQLHPNERGYQIWAEAMEPTLAKLLGDQPVR